MIRPLCRLTPSLVFAFTLGLGWNTVLQAEPRPVPAPTNDYGTPVVDTFGMPSILVRGVALDSLPNRVQPEYLNLDPDLPSTATASGLPPGLSIAADKTIRGTPAQKGIYRAKIQVSNPFGRSLPAIWVVQVVDEPQRDFGPGGSFLGVGAPGIYNGADDPTYNKRITRIELEVTPAGAFSGSLTIRQDKRRFAGQLEMTTYDNALRVAEVQLKNMSGGATKVILRLEQTERPGFSRSMDAHVSVNDQPSEPARLFPRLEPSQDERRLLTGRHNITLDDDQVSGFASLYLSRGLSATVAGTLPDGMRFTTSSPLVREQANYGNPFMLLGHDGGKDGVLRGEIGFGINLTSEGAFLEDTVGSLMWTSPPGKRSIWPDGVERQLRVDGGLYVPPRAGELLLADAPRSIENARLSLTGSLLDFPDYSLQAFTLNAAHRAVFPPGAGNPHRARLDFYAPTGFFTGQFTFVYNLPGPVAKRLSRQIPFRGLIIPAEGRRGVGRGFFLLPSPPDPNGFPPTTWADSPILSGGVRVSVEQP